MSKDTNEKLSNQDALEMLKSLEKDEKGNTYSNALWKKLGFNADQKDFPIVREQVISQVLSSAELPEDVRKNLQEIQQMDEGGLWNSTYKALSNITGGLVADRKGYRAQLLTKAYKGLNLSVLRSSQNDNHIGDEMIRAGELVEKVGQVVSGDFDQVIADMADTVIDGQKKTVEAVGHGVGALGGVAEAVGDGVIKAQKKVADNVVSGTKTVGNVIVELANGPMPQMEQAVIGGEQAMVGAVKEGFKAVGDGMVAFGNGVVLGSERLVADGVVGGFNGFGQAVTEAGAVVVDLGQAVNKFENSSSHQGRLDIQRSTSPASLRK